MKVIQDMTVLKAMQRRGLIRFHEDTGKLVGQLFSNRKAKAYYIDGGPRTVFDYDDSRYQIKYFDGCFCPFVVEIGPRLMTEEEKIVWGIPLERVCYVNVN
jgi:hypothetical protein